MKIVELSVDCASHEAALWEKGCDIRPNTKLEIQQASGNVLDASPDDICLLLHTSGTTSLPKAVPLTHTNIYTTINNIVDTYNLTERDITLLVMPLFHVHGLIGALLPTLGSGGLVVIPKTGKFSASTFWSDVVGHGVTWYTAAPTIHKVLQ